MVSTRIPPRRPGSPIDHKPHSPRCHFCSAQLKCEVHGGTIRSEKVECEYDPGALSRATNFDCPVQDGKAACDFSSIKSKLPGGVSSGWSYDGILRAWSGLVIVVVGNSISIRTLSVTLPVPVHRLRLPLYTACPPSLESLQLRYRLHRWQPVCVLLQRCRLFGDDP